MKSSSLTQGQLFSFSLEQSGVNTIRLIACGRSEDRIVYGRMDKQTGRQTEREREREDTASCIRTVLVAQGLGEERDARKQRHCMMRAGPFDEQVKMLMHQTKTGDQLSKAPRK